MANLLVITQKVDQEDDLSGFFVDWLREFSLCFEHVFVITLLEGKHDLPANISVYSLGKERGNPRWKRAIRFYYYLFKLIPKSNSLFAHMSPAFVVAAWPVAAIWRRRIVFWYLHRSVTLRLKIAEKLCWRIVTAAKESLYLKSKKIVEVGHGIDIRRFITTRNWTEASSRPMRLLSVGRISKIKGYETIINALALMKRDDVDIDLTIVGRPVMPTDNAYADSLKVSIKKLNLENVIQLEGYVPYYDTPKYYKDADIFINATPPGGIDKVVLEAMAAGMIVMTSNSAFAKYFGPYADQLIFKHDDPKDLEQKLRAILELSATGKDDISQFLFRVVSEQHNLQQLIARIVKLLKHS